MEILNVQLITDVERDVTGVYILLQLDNGDPREFGYLYNGIQSLDSPKIQEFLQHIATRYDISLQALIDAVNHEER